METELGASTKSSRDAVVKEESSALPVASPNRPPAARMESYVQSESAAKISFTLEEPDPTVTDSGLASVAAQQLFRGSFVTCSDIYDLAFIFEFSISASNLLSATNTVLSIGSNLVCHSVL